MTDSAVTVTPNETEVVANATTTVVVASTPGGASIVETFERVSVAAPDVIVVEVSTGGAGGGTAGDPAGTAAALVAAHEAAADPHPQYLTAAEGNAAYLALAAFTWANIGGKPTTLAGFGITDAVAASAFTWANLGSKPTTFAGLGLPLLGSDVPAHDWTKITTGKPTTLGGYGITNALAYAANVTAATLHDNATLAPGHYTISTGLPNADNSGTFAPAWHHVINLKHADGNGYASQIATAFGNNGSGNGLYYRSASGFVWSAWRKIWHEGNDGAGSGLDADTLDGHDSAYFAPAATTLAGYGITDALPASQKGAASGVASLDATGKVPSSQLPAAITGQVVYQSVWDATSGAPSASPQKGYYWVVNVAGSTNLSGITDWKVGDWAIYNGASWDKVDNTDAISSWNGRTGAIIPAANDYTFAQIGSKPTTLSGYGITDAVATAAFTWANLSGKPTTFPPSAHTHVVADITDLPAISSAAGNSTIVQRTVNGYIYCNFVNLSGALTATVSTSVMVETGSDGFVRKKSVANFRTQDVGLWVQSADPGASAKDGDLWIW